MAAAALLVFVLSACGSEQPKAGPDPADIQLLKPGSLTVCTQLSYRPFIFADDSGRVVGFDMDMAQLAANRLGATVEVVDTDLESILSGRVFEDKKCDLGVGAITRTEDREDDVQFSDNYFDASQAMLVKQGGPINLQQLRGKKVGVQAATTGQAYAEERAGKNRYQTIAFEGLPAELAALQSGQVEAVINDNGPLLDFAKKTPGYQVTTEFNTGDKYGLVGPKRDGNADDLLELFDAELFMAIRNGGYTATYKKWFNAEPLALPQPD